MLKLGFRLLAPEQLGERDVPFPAQLRLAVTGWSGFLDDETDMRFMSPLLATEGEIDQYINQYKEELDRVAKEAKQSLNRANNRTLEMLGQRKVQG